MKKRILSLLLVLVLVIVQLSVTVRAAELDNGLQYEIKKDYNANEITEYVEITGYVGDAAELSIPAEIEGLPVTSISNFAFANSETLTSVSIPGSVTSIGFKVLSSCPNLTSISLPDSVTSIGFHAFSNCPRLTEIDVDANNPNYSSDHRGVLFNKEKTQLIQAPGAITGFYAMPDCVTSIGYGAFNGCSGLTIIAIPDGVTSIGYEAFSHCTGLTSLSIPDGVTFIDYNTFAYCSNLTDIEIPDGVTMIDDGAFDGCSSLTGISIPDGVTSIGDYSFRDCVSLTSITIPGSVASIGDDAFFGCTALASIDIQAGVGSIGGWAFHGCSKLTSIAIPSSVGSIGTDAFSGCSSLTGIYVDDDNMNYSSDNRGVFFDKEKTHLIHAPGAITGPYAIPDGVTAIGERAFSDCTSLTGISIPDGVTAIADYTFVNCESLTSVSIPDSVTAIGNEAFFGCSSLTGIAIPDSVTFIGEQAFADCRSLSSFSIPAGVTEIGYYTFSHCYNLTSISIPENVTAIGDEVFYYCVRLDTIHFKGDAPAFGENVFGEVEATAYYPADNDTWTVEVMQDYGGVITWVPCNPNNPFTDVPADSFYEEPVLWALENGITTGASADSFNPGGQCLRAHVVTFLHRAAENPEPTAVDNPFTDVKSTDFFYKPVLWAVEKGITNGVSADKFGSYDVCNRAAVVTFLWRAAGSPEPTSTDNPFTDVKTTDFFYKPVLWAVENGITNGVDATHFGPTAACNRAQVVTFLYRAYN